MTFFSNILLGISGIVQMLFDAYGWVIIAAALASWLHLAPYHPVSRALHALTEPVFYRIRKWFPFTFTSNIDFSPLAALVLLRILEVIVINVFYQLARFAG